MRQRLQEFESIIIPPVDAGGIAGGEKVACGGVLWTRGENGSDDLSYAQFLRNGIFLKFAVDSHNLYGGDDKAMKAASHEMKGLSDLLRCALRRTHVPHAKG